jgi:hypothetical protein
MEQIATTTPGTYFIFCVQAHRILAKTDTLKKLEPAPRTKSAGAAQEFTAAFSK